MIPLYPPHKTDKCSPYGLANNGIARRFSASKRESPSRQIWDAAQINDWRRQGRELANAQGAHFALGFLRE